MPNFDCGLGKPTSTTRRVYKDNFCPNAPFSKTCCGSNKEHIFDNTASKHNFCDDNLAPQTNQTPTTPTDQGVRLIEGVAGDLAAGVFNPTTPLGAP